MTTTFGNEHVLPCIGCNIQYLSPHYHGLVGWASITCYGRATCILYPICSTLIDDFFFLRLHLSNSGLVQAFPKGSQLAIDFSTAILTLSENGELQRIYDQWLSTSTCSTSSVTVTSNQLGLGTFWGLFLITGMASLLCCIIYLIRMAYLHKKMAGSRIGNQVSLL